MEKSMVERVERWTLQSAGGPHDHVAPAERVATGLAGIGLLMLSRRTSWQVPGAIVAGALLARAATASRPAAAAMEAFTSAAPRSLAEGDGQHVDEVITITRPAQEVYTFWRNVSSISTACRRVRAFPLDDTRSRWEVLPESGDGVALLEWTSTLIDDVPGKLLTWRTSAGADVPSMGHVRFSPTASDRGRTEVRVHLHYAPPLGRIGAAVASMAGPDPAVLVRESLQEIKRYLELEHSPSLTDAGIPGMEGRE